MPTPFPTEQLTRAVTLQNQGDLAAAQAIYWDILLDNPAQFDALHLLGVSRCQQSRQAEGAWFIARALEQQPEHTGARYNLAMALAALHRHDDALAHFDLALAKAPQHASSWVGRGDSLQKLGRFDEAVENYRRALALQPNLPGTLSNLGQALLATGQTRAALELFHQALAGGADRSVVLLNIGRAQQELGETQAARASFAAACAAAPDAAQPRWLHALATLPDIAADDAEIAASRPALAAALEDLAAWYAADGSDRRDRLELGWPFFLAYQARNNLALMRQFGSLRARLLEEWRQRQPAPRAPAAVRRPGVGGPVHVGIVSAQLHSHSVWHAISRGWFADIDPARIALHAFQIGGKTDAETAFARARAASFTTGERSLAGWVEAIAAQQPDALIYPALGMDTLSANLAGLRLARVQLASWGHPETTGLPTVDAFLSAEAFEPPGAEAAYSESLIRLPGLGVSFAPRTVVPRAPDLAALGIDPDRPILVCPGAPFKYAPADDPILANIARGIGDGQLIFLHGRNSAALSERLERRLTASFAHAGLDFAAHARFIPHQPMERFFGLLQRADLCLDSIGFSGFNTAMQVLAQGTPLVAWEGAFLRGRLASGILRSLDLPELVASDAAGFVAIATRLATDAAARAGMRARITARVPSLYNDPAPVRALEDTLESLVHGTISPAHAIGLATALSTSRS